MCGIVGYIASAHHEGELAETLVAMHHRGPDSQQMELLECGDLHIGLGHVRLSILDLDPRSNQPFSMDDGRYWIVFNGEIYNYQKIKNRLIDLGYEFRTTSDTEVFLAAFKEYGIDCVREFRGIFVATVIDLQKKQIYLVRDQLGIKPVYYYQTETGDLYFASEIKALFKFDDVPLDISRYDLCQSLNLGFPLEPNTGFTGVKKVFPGAYLSLESDGKYYETRYYQPSVEAHASTTEIEGAVKQATREQSEADVNVALLYSGGLDSSVLAYFLGKKTKSLFFESDAEELKSAGMIDDRFYAEEISNEFDLDTQYIQPNVNQEMDFLAEIDHIAALVEEPTSDYTFVASERLCRQAKENGFTVVLSGMGGDEAYGGYPRYILAKQYRYMKIFGFIFKLLAPLLSKNKRLAKRIQRLLSFLKAPDFLSGYTRLIGFLSTNEIKSLLSDDALLKKFKGEIEALMAPYHHLSQLKQAMIFDYYGFLSHNLIVADKSSMQASVEMRVPLLDLDVYQMGLSQPAEGLISGKKQKVRLQQILDKYLPSKLVNRPKTGFNPPLDDKIRNLGENKILERLKSGVLSQYFNIQVVDKIVHDHFAGKENNTFKIWQLLFLHAWLKTWGQVDHG